MSDFERLLREKRLGKNGLAKLQIKAFSSPYVYQVLCYYNDLIIAKFIIRGVKENRLKKMFSQNFMFFNINSEGSGKFYFEKKLVEILDELGGIHEPIEILDYKDVPITSFKFEKMINNLI